MFRMIKNIKNRLHQQKRKMRILNGQYNCNITGLVVFDKQNLRFCYSIVVLRCYLTPFTGLLPFTPLDI